MQFGILGTSLSLIREGKLRALAVTTERRLEELPDVPTMIESGLPGYDVSLLVRGGHAGRDARADRHAAQSRDQRIHGDARGEARAGGAGDPRHLGHAGSACASASPRKSSSGAASPRRPASSRSDGAAGVRRCERNWRQSSAPINPPSAIDPNPCLRPKAFTGCSIASGLAHEVVWSAACGACADIVRRQRRGSHHQRRGRLSPPVFCPLSGYPEFRRHGRDRRRLPVGLHPGARHPAARQGLCDRRRQAGLSRGVAAGWARRPLAGRRPDAADDGSPIRPACAAGSRGTAG